MNLVFLLLKLVILEWPTMMAVGMSSLESCSDSSSSIEVSLKILQCFILFMDPAKLSMSLYCVRCLSLGEDNGPFGHATNYGCHG